VSQSPPGSLVVDCLPVSHRPPVAARRCPDCCAGLRSLTSLARGVDVLRGTGAGRRCTSDTAAPTDIGFNYSPSGQLPRALARVPAASEPRIPFSRAVGRPAFDADIDFSRCVRTDRRTNAATYGRPRRSAERHQLTARASTDAWFNRRTTCALVATL